MSRSYSIAGSFCYAEGFKEKTLHIDNNIIMRSADGVNPQATYIFDDQSQIFPGMIDLHVHCREDQSGIHNYKETFSSAAKAAKNGGVTLIADMPNTPTPLVDEKSYFEKMALSKRAGVPILHYCQIDLKSHPISLPIAYKFYMRGSLMEMDELLSRFSGYSIAFHCEDVEVLKKCAHFNNHHDRRPLEAELKALEDAITLTKKYNIKANFCHLSSSESLKMVRKAKMEGYDYYSEVTPHHLFLSYEDFQTVSLDQNVNPPLRSLQVRNKLLSSVIDGDADMLATDHAPHSKADKARGASGFIGLDHYGSAAMKLLYDYKISHPNLLKLTSLNAVNFAKAWNVTPTRGFNAGDEASFTILSRAPVADFSLSSLSQNLPREDWIPFYRSHHFLSE